MQYCGIILTGPKGAGKTEIANRLVANSDFQIVPAITTRESRLSGDEDYDFVNEEEFNQYQKSGDLFVYDEYLGNKYGIQTKSLKKIIENNKIPVLIITPKSLEILNKTELQKYHFLSFFLDVPTQELQERLTFRDSNIQTEVFKQIGDDRKYKDEAIYKLQNIEKDNTSNLIQLLWENRNAMGMVPERIIKALIEGGTLLKNADVKNTKGASYDLSLGDQYWQNGEKHILDNDKVFIKLKPGDFVIVSSKEIAELPNNISARFDLTVSLFFRGVILSNGPQVDPGFRGRLFCSLFNLSNSTIELKRNQHYSTIEFIKLSEPTIAYHDKYQDKEGILDYLAKSSDPSTIVKIWDEIYNLKKASFWERTLPLILSFFAFVITIGLAIFLFVLENNP